MKVIKVDSCLYCPFRGGIGAPACTSKLTYGMELKDLNIIHPDCKLEDYKWQDGN
jgi:delta-aminolevulinic acid dehydratase/porphobilinogen synthase